MKSVIACVLILCCCGPSAFAQQNDWQVVEAVPTGVRLRVELAKVPPTEGILQAVSSADLTLFSKPAFPRPSVRKVELLGDRQTAKGAQHGFWIGAALGALAGAITSNHALVIAWQASSTGLFGAGIGALSGLSFRERTVIYEQP